MKIEPVTRQSLTFGVQATGQIEASPSRRVEVTNPVGGTVVRLLMEPGDIVEAGQPLAVITSGELAELRVTALENSAERQYDRDKELAEQGAIPRREFLESEAHLAVARQALTEAESQLEVLEARTDSGFQMNKPQ